MSGRPSQVWPSMRRELAEFRSSLRLYRRLIPYVRVQWRLLSLTVGVMLGVTVFTLAQPWPLQVIVDSVLGDRPTPGWLRAVTGELGDRPLLWVAAGLLVFALVAGQVLRLAQEYLSQLLGQRLVFALRCDLWAKLQRLFITFHDNSTVGDLIYRVTGDAAALQDVVTYGFVPLGVQLLTAVGISVAIFLLNPTLGFIAVGSMPLLVVWTIWSSERVKRRSRGLASAESGLYTTVSEVLGSVRAVKAHGAEDLEIERFRARARSSQDEYVSVMALSTIGGLGNTVLAELSIIAVVVVGSLAALGGQMTVGDLLVFIAYLRSLQAPVAQVAGGALVLQRSGASIERVMEILDQHDERAGAGTERLGRVKGGVAFQDVSFSYGERAPAVEHVDLVVAPGETVALVGRSGAGKTTLASLILRFYVPDSGRILLDGVDTASLDLPWLRDQVSLVLQEPITFSGSLAENIAYGEPTASRAQIEEAAEAAGLHDFITGLPEGYDTQVGERGVRLSGGQRQRLSIARAFLKDTPILVLDEPTSSLDATTERHIFESLDRLSSGVPAVFELAVGGPGPVDDLSAHGWHVRDPRPPTLDPWTFQRFIRGSRAEFSVAKQGYTSTRSGWFSERTAGYLASGRPVLIQETGFSDWLEASPGVLAFTTVDEAAAAVVDLAVDYPARCRAARDVAAEYFDARDVLPRLLEDAMVGATRGATARVRPAPAGR